MAAGFFERSALSGLRATAEALFPENDHGAPDHLTTALVPRTLEYLGELPLPQRRLVTALFALVELAAPFLILGFSRFSKLSVRRRETAVRAWRRSRLLPLRLLGDALKATMTLMYMSHPAALAHVGAYAASARPLDPLQVPVRPDVLAGAGAPE
jgi:hypothetical protein